MRYTEARLSRIATEMLRDLDADTVDFTPNYDGSQQEPLVLPARFPNLLVNGSSGIAVGMATNIPPHNLRETIGAVIAFIEDPDIDVEGLMKHIKGPDFPTGGIILGMTGIREAYASGRGRVRVQARAHIEPLKQGKEAIVVTELPYMVKKGGDGGLIQKIADLVKEKKINGISDIEDHSDKRGMRLVIELKRDAIPKVVLNQLYKHTPMQTTFGVNMVALVDGVPRTLSLRQAIEAYVRHQREVIVRRTKFELCREGAPRPHPRRPAGRAGQPRRGHRTIRASRDGDAARHALMDGFSLTQVQAHAIVEMRLRQLTALESDKIRSEHKDILERIKELREILGDEEKVMGIIKDELQEISDTYGDERRTQITHAEGEIDIEDLIADQQMVITITKSGYIKSLPLSTYRNQHRGGVGVTGMDMKDGDFIEHLFVCSTHDFLLFFTNRGKVYRSKVYELPEASRTAKGRALDQLPAAARGRAGAVGHRHARLLRGQLSRLRHAQGPDQEDRVPGLQHADQGRRDHRDQDPRRRRAGRRAQDRAATTTSSWSRARARPPASTSRRRAPMGRDTGGVRGMNVSQKGNAVLAMDVARDDHELLVVTENGYGKRTPIPDYPARTAAPWASRRSR